MSFVHRLAGIAALASVAGLPLWAATIAAPGKPAAPAAKPADWLSVVVSTPQGGFRQGNPNAKVKLLEFGALTCHYCSAFATGESGERLGGLDEADEEFVVPCGDLAPQSD